jgi:hypothetical protein
VLATAVLGGCAVFAAQVDAPPEAMILTGLLTVGVLLGLPDIIEAALRVLPEREPRWRLARRQLASDVRRLTAAVAVLTVLVSASSGYLTLLDTLVRTADRQAYPDVLPGQLLISDRGSTLLPPPRVVAEQLERSGIADGSARLQLRYALALDASGAATRTVTREGSEANILTLDSIEQVAHLVGHRLTRDQQATLRAGGLLVWSGAAGIPRSPRGRTRLVLRAGDAITGRTPDLPVASVDVGLAGWRVGTDGILLTSRARALKLPIQSGSLMYTGLTQRQAEAVQRSVTDAGLDAKTVQIYSAPPPAIPPAALIATAVGLVMLVLLASLVATHGQTRTLRSYLGRLISIGLPMSWARRVLLYQHAVTVAVSVVLGSSIAVIPVLVLVARVSGFVLSIPWAEISVLISAICLAVLLAAIRSTRQLTARDGIIAGT